MKVGRTIRFSVPFRQGFGQSIGDSNTCKRGPCQQLIFRDVWETACLQRMHTIDDRENFTSVKVAAERKQNSHQLADDGLISVTKIITKQPRARAANINELQRAGHLSSRFTPTRSAALQVCFRHLGNRTRNRQHDSHRTS